MANKTARKLEDLRRIGPRSGVIQIVPTKVDVRPAVVRSDDPDAQDLVTRPLASPTGPGGAKGFRNRAGSTIASPAVTNVYLGPFWGDQQFIEGFSKAIVENGYLDPLNELGYGTGSGVYLSNVTGPTLEAGSTFSDADARVLLIKMMDQGYLHGDPNSLFMLILPDKVTSQMGDSSKSCSDYCGYHDALPYNGTDIAYAVLPSPLCEGCGGQAQDFTAVYAHELAEACTDKVPGKGWVADDGSENGDLEAWILFPWGPPQNPNLYTVQGYYTNERGNTIGPWRTPASRTRLASATAAKRVTAARLRAAVAADLDPDTCTEIVVDHTPKPGNFRGADQLLRELGIMGPDEVEAHQAAIIADVAQRGFTIDATDISSGPSISIGTCSQSVHDNAQ
jgi:hypothetical protein